MKEIPEGKTVVLFDGVCNFCDQYVQKIIKWDTNNQFVFASLQSEIGQKIRKHIGLNDSVDSMVYYRPGYAYFIKSDAILQIVKDVNLWMHPIAMVRILPKGIRDFGYDYFAKNRYQWFGKKDECMIPSPEIRAKFLQ